MRMRGLRQGPGSLNPCIFSTVGCHLLPQTLGGSTSATAVVQFVHLRLETWYLKGTMEWAWGPCLGHLYSVGILRVEEGRKWGGLTGNPAFLFGTSP